MKTETGSKNPTTRVPTQQTDAWKKENLPPTYVEPRGFDKWCQRPTLQDVEEGKDSPELVEEVELCEVCHEPSKAAVHNQLCNATPEASVSIAGEPEPQEGEYDEPAPVSYIGPAPFTLDARLAPAARKPLLSLLIPTVPARSKTFKELTDMLKAQINALPDPSIIEVCVGMDNGEKMVGKKRNELLEMASGEYLCFIDDDDRIFGDYIVRIVDALKTKPDVVGITIFWTDNIFNAVRLLVRSLEHSKVHWLNSEKNIAFGRPAHLNPTRSDIAKSVKFREDVISGEDAAWSAQVVGKLKTTVNIDEPIYHYNFKTAGTLTQRPGAREAMRPPLKEGYQRVLRDGKIVILDGSGKVVADEEGKAA